MASRPDWLTRRFKKLVDGQGLPPARLHDLGHGAAGVEAAAGMGPKADSGGHGPLHRLDTIDTYSCIFKSVAAVAVQKSADLPMSHVKLRWALPGVYQA